MMRAMSSAWQESDLFNVQVLIDSIPALIHTARPDGYLDCVNKPWLEYFGATLDKVTGWNWTAFVHPEDVEEIVAKWREPDSRLEKSSCAKRASAEPTENTAVSVLSRLPAGDRSRTACSTAASAASVL